MKGMSEVEKPSLPRLNFRLFVILAVGLASGIFLYDRFRFGGVRPSDFCFPALFLLAAFAPAGAKRTLALLLSFFLLAGAGAGLAHLAAVRYGDGRESGQYAVTGTVLSVSEGGGVCSALLGGLSFEGEEAGGKLEAHFPDGVSPGDVVTFRAGVERLDPSGDAYGDYLFSADIRYRASVSAFEKSGETGDPFLRIKAALFSTLRTHLGKTEAAVAYALLTGDSHAVDGTVMDGVRRGGIAHLFAVSGLHIGILYGAVYFLFKRPLRAFAFLPALLAACLYTAFCGFTVSSLRALVMCGILGATRAAGQKYDFADSIAIAALVVLAVFPTQWLSAGFRLSFGACLGLALWSGPLSRAFSRLKAVGRYLAASISVQLFTFPILFETFGYFPLWGLLLNPVAVPLLPVLFLPLLVSSIFALAIPPAAGVFLAVPAGLLALFVAVFSVADFSAVLSGFSLGAGSVVFLTANVFLSERIRMRAFWRAACALLLSVLFAATLIWENCVFSGGRVYVAEGKGGAALVVTPSCTVLLVDGDVSKDTCGDLLLRRYAGTLDAVFVLADDELAGINTAVFLGADCVCACDPVPTGLQETELRFGRSFSFGGLTFRYETRSKLAVAGEGVVLEFDFGGNAALGADFFVGSGDAGLKFSFGSGIIKKI